MDIELPQDFKEFLRLLDAEHVECLLIDGVMVNIINLNHLKDNKKASGRHRDLDDLEHLT